MRSARSVASGHTLNSPAGYQRLDSTSKTLKLSNDLGRVFSKFRPIIFSIVVDKVALLKQARSDSPLGIAYALLHERIALSIEKLFGNESAVIIADQQTQHEHYFRSGGMSAARDALARNLREKPKFNLHNHALHAGRHRAGATVVSLARNQTCNGDPLDVRIDRAKRVCDLPTDTALSSPLAPST